MPDSSINAGSHAGTTSGNAGHCVGLLIGIAPLRADIAQGFADAGVPILEGYGLTESSPVITMTAPGRIRAGSVGTPVAGVEVQIAADGEILTRGPHVMRGYWRDADATAAVIIDGWLRTGDVGRLEADGTLTISDRKKDLIVTAGGKNVVPAHLEQVLVSDPWIDQALAYGDRRPFVSALIVPNFELLRSFTEQRRIACQVDEEFIVHEEIHAMFAARIAELMQQVSQPERVKQFLLLARPFGQSTGEMTTTMKLRRRFITEKYARQLETLYQPSAPAPAARNDVAR